LIPAAFEYVRAHSVEEAVHLLSEADSRAIAGGQSLLTQLKLRQLRVDRIVDVGFIPGLRQIEESTEGVRVGALVTMRQLLTDEVAVRHLPLLTLAAGCVGDVQVRNRATIGGGIVYADPAGDISCASIAAGGVARIVTPGGEMSVPVEEMFTGPFATKLPASGLLTHIDFPSHQGGAVAYEIVARRPADPTVAGIALLRTGTRADSISCRAAAAGLADRPTFLHQTSRAVSESLNRSDSDLAEAFSILTEEIRPDSNVAASARYRSTVGRTMLARAVTKVKGES
jgi:CO/xanthine dehydrogenase FAD-binding subunit